MSIEAVMLVAFGFLAAMLLALAIAPAYKRRAEKLTKLAMRNAMPLTEAEIRADKDRMRADFAIQIHELNGSLEQIWQTAARQRVEINRRDAVIVGLEEKLEALTGSLDEQDNARRVLERTIVDRLPTVERKLAEARDLLEARDRQLEELTRTATTQAGALEETTQIRIKTQDELQRLKATLNSRESRQRDGSAEARYETEVALRSEIESLRAKSREQMALVDKLEKSRASADARRSEYAEEIGRLRKEIASTRSELKKMSAGSTDKASVEGKKAPAEGGRPKDTDRLLAHDDEMKERIAVLEKERDREKATAERLRAELASATSRLTQQADEQKDQLKMAGAGRRSVISSVSAAAVQAVGTGLAAKKASINLIERLGPAGNDADADKSSQPAASDQANASRTNGGSDPAVAKPDVTTEDAGTATGPKPARTGGLLERITRLDDAE